MANCGIYMMRCVPTGRVYIGQATDIRRRWNGHRTYLAKGTHHSGYLQRSWIKYGAGAFTWELLERVEPARLTEREQHYIDLYRAANQRYGFNVCPAAASNLGRKATRATRARQSKAALGKVKTPEHRANLAVAHMGKTHSAEHTAKSAAGRRGQKASEKARANLAHCWAAR